MKKNRRITIGVLIGNADSPHTRGLIRGISRAAQHMDVNVILYLGMHTGSYYRTVFGEQNTTESIYDYQMNVVYDYALLGGVDALIIAYGSLDIYLEHNDREQFLAKFRGIPHVLAEECGDGTESAVISDNYRGMKELAQHLITVHHCRNFCYLAGPSGNTDAEERRKAVEDALKEAGLPFDASRIEYGDYSSAVSLPVERLLTQHPDADALMCANDVMAAAAYKVCAARGLRVGRDILVTGYDDADEISVSLMPALTTVRQNPYDLGWRCMEKAAALCRGEQTGPEKLTAEVMLRDSCGCRNQQPENLFSADTLEEQLKKMASFIAGDTVWSAYDAPIRQQVEKELDWVFAEALRLSREDPDMTKKESRNFLDAVSRLLAGEISESISMPSLLHDVMICKRFLAGRYSGETQHQGTLRISNLLQQAIEKSILQKNKEESDEFRNITWFLSLISRNMIDHIGSEQKFYAAALELLPSMKMDHAFLFILDKPVEHTSGAPWSCPEHLRLAAKLDTSGGQAYSRAKQPILSRSNGMSDRFEVFRREKQTTLSVIPLFTGRRQYGVLAAQVREENLPLLYLAGMQISLALDFRRLTLIQKQTQMQLKNALHDVNDKNTILNFLSETDQLTDCLNRRGFIEKAVSFCTRSRGKQGVLFFADLDHLKEINDVFGHIEGDFAIRTAADCMRRAAAPGAIIARIGGDEFVVLQREEAAGQEAFIRKVHENCARVNEVSGKPYYIELSCGAASFECRPGMQLGQLIADADQYLYSEKKKRRPSLIREKRTE